MRKYIHLSIFIGLFLIGGFLGYFIGNHNKPETTKEENHNQYVCTFTHDFVVKKIWIDPAYNDIMYSYAADRYYDLYNEYPSSYNLSCTIINE